MPETTKQLHFSVQGSLINNLSREKFYYNNDLPGAIDLLLNCLVTDQLTLEQRVCLALAIIDGRKELVGVYPGDDYGVQDVPEDRRPKNNIISKFENIAKQLEEAKNQSKMFRDKLACIAENLDERQLTYIDACWRSGYAEDAGDESYTIFGSTPLQKDGIMAAVADILDEDADPLQKAMAPMVDEYLQRMTSKCDEPDYGWLFPDGTFHPVEFGDHFNWAFNWLKQNDPDWSDAKKRLAKHIDLTDAGDYLATKYHAVLLHNPALGYAKVTSLDIRGMTKAQKEFMYDYYMKRGLNKSANDIWKED